MLAEGLDKMQAMGVRNTGNLFKKLRYRVRYRDNEAELIQYIMPRYGFIQMSQGGKGSTLKNGKRTGGTARPFLKQAIDNNQEELGDYVASMYADKLVGLIDIGVRY